MGEIVWTPSEEWVERTHLYGFMKTAPGSPSDYEELWRWSVEDISGLWEKVWRDCGVIAFRPYAQVMGGPQGCRARSGSPVPS